MGGTVTLPQGADVDPNVEMAPLRRRNVNDDASSSPSTAGAPYGKAAVLSVVNRHYMASLLWWIFQCVCRCFCGVIFALFALLAIVYAVDKFIINRKQGLLGKGRSSFPPSTTKAGERYTHLGSYKLLQTVPHHTGAFTQGLLVAAPDKDTGRLQMYEGTGLHGHSDLRLLNINSGVVLKRYKLPGTRFFGEGIAHFRVDNELHLIQLTWKERTAFEYILEGPNLGRPLPSPVANWTFQTTANQGWGITYARESATKSGESAQVFYVSDGSTYLHTWDLKSKRQIRKVEVQYQRPDMKQKKSIHYLNELEWDPSTNTVLTNVLNEDLVIRVNASDGFVQTIYDLSTLYPTSKRSLHDDVLNGIALTYDSTLANTSESHDELWVTGKFWPSMYRIPLIELD